MPLNKFQSKLNLNMIHKDWIVNLSNIQLPNDVQLLLQLGHRFNLPINDKKTEKEEVTIEFIKHIEKNIFNFNDAISNSIRNDAIPILYKWNYTDLAFDVNQKLINRWITATIRFMKDNHKGNVTVVLEIIYIHLN